MNNPITKGAVERVALAIHEGLGGNGWAYADYGGDEWNSRRAALLSAAEAAIEALNLGELVTALEGARETLRLITKERRVIGPLSTRALNDCHAISTALAHFRGGVSG